MTTTLSRIAAATGMNPTPDLVPPLRVRQWDRGPDDLTDTHRREWAVETLLALAHDYQEPDLVTALIALLGGDEEDQRDALDVLYGRADAAAATEQGGPREAHYAAVDDYCAVLHGLPQRRVA